MGLEKNKDYVVSPKKQVKKKISKKSLNEDDNLKKSNNLYPDDENEYEKNNMKLDPIEIFDKKIKEKPLLIILNKLDLKGKISKETIAKNLGLYKLKHINWQIMETSCITGQGIFECLDWVLENVLIKEDSKVYEVKEKNKRK